MTGNDDSTRDETISAAWREASTDTSPHSLDRKVLREAARAAGRTARMPAWTRPLAFAATLVLGVALLLHMQAELDSPYPPAELPVPGRQPATSPGATAPAEADAARAAEQSPVAAPPEQADEVRAVQESSTGADPGPAAGNSAEPQPALYEARTETPALRQERPRDAAELERSAEDAGRSLQSIAITGQQDAVAQSFATKRRADTADDERCTPEQRADADRWRECIERLAAAGFAELAQQEREAYAETYPDAAPP